MRTLILDDSKPIRKLLRMYVQVHDIDVIEVEDGIDGVESLERIGHVDLAMVDWEMPHMNGIEFIKTVKSKPELSDMKILMVTSRNTMSDLAEAMKIGTDDFLMKPFTEEMVLDKLRILGVLN